MKTSLAGLFFIISFQLLAGRNLPESLKENWKEKVVFFGVNKAWDYLKQEHTTLTYLARDEALDYKGFSQEKYWTGLKKARQMGLKFAGITDWTINKKSLKERGPNEILIKIEGTYKVKRGLVHFVEWQHFIGEQYHQVTLTEDLHGDLDDTDKVPQAEVNQLMRSVLKLNEQSGRIKK